MNPQSVVIGESIKLATNTFVRKNYTFKGWAIDATAITATYTNGQSIRPTKDMTLYAVWGCNHSYNSEVTTSTSCTTSGVKTYTCSNCGDSYTEVIAATGHNYEGKITNSASCTTSGVKTYTCSKCGDTYTETIYGGHNYSYRVKSDHLIKQAVTCTTGTQYYYKCWYCTSYTTSSWWEDTDNLGHVEGEVKYEQNVRSSNEYGNYTDNHNVIKICSRCENEISRECVVCSWDYNYTYYSDAICLKKT